MDGEIAGAGVVIDRRCDGKSGKAKFMSRSRKRRGTVHCLAGNSRKIFRWA